MTNNEITSLVNKLDSILLKELNGMDLINHFDIISNLFMKYLVICSSGKKDLKINSENIKEAALLNWKFKEELMKSLTRINN